MVFPSFIESDNGIEYITPLDDNNFIDALHEFSNIDGLILHYDKSSNLEEYNKFILIDDDNLSRYSVENGIVRDFSNTKIYDSENPMHMGFMAQVNMNE